MRDTVKTLTIRQPWAWLIVNGLKDVENRSWSTRYRGPLVIQSAARIGNRSEFFALCRDIERETGKRLPADFTLGSTEGIVTLSDIITNSRSIWAYDGDYHWILTNPIRLPNISISGKLGLWDLSLKSLQDDTAVETITRYITRYKAR